jgi:Tfp pilus assembly protein PilF
LETLFQQGNQYLAAGDAVAAEQCFRAALQIAPCQPELHANLAYVLQLQGDLRQAHAHYESALDLDPTLAQVHLNYGTLLHAQKHLAQAQEAYTQAIVLMPEAPGGWSNLGGLFASTKQDALAELCCRQALARDANHIKAHINLAYVLLRQGRFEEGWRCLERRDWYASLQAALPCLRWQGEPVQGKTLLMVQEAGHGDMIQWVRYAAVLKHQGAASIGVLCHPALTSLMTTLDGVDQVLSFDDELPAAAWDCWTPVFSLPYHCQTRLNTVPASIAYLHAPAHLLAKWQSLQVSGDLHVGLVWQGNPLFDNDADRSLPVLELLAPLWQVPGVTFISLQKGQGEDQARHPPPGQALLNLGAQIDDFADTAAIITQLDLVIAVDTAVAHLAGALGKPCWVLLPAYQTDWRWLEGRSDSPWYPGVLRLFRQSQPGDWSDVVAQLQSALATFAADRAARSTP